MNLRESVASGISWGLAFAPAPKSWSGQMVRHAWELLSRLLVANDNGAP